MPKDVYDYIVEAEDRARILRTQRGDDYGNNRVQINDYFPLGWPSYVQMVYLKAKRLVSILPEVQSGKRSPEAFLDSLLDGINYSLFFAARILEDLQEQDTEERESLDDFEYEKEPEKEMVYTDEYKKQFRETLCNYYAINAVDFNLSREQHKGYRTLLESGKVKSGKVKSIKAPIDFVNGGNGKSPFPSVSMNIYLTPSGVLMQEILDLDEIPVFVNRYYKSQLEEGVDIIKESRDGHGNFTFRKATDTI